MMQSIMPISSEAHNISPHQVSNNNHAQIDAPRNDHDTKSIQTVHDTKKTRQETLKKQQTHKEFTKNVAKEKVDVSENNKAEKSKTINLETQKNYTSDNLTASEAAMKEQDILESVKSTKPDGTETYYFPVPVEVLTQLPPPGNIGLSQKMMEDIMQNSQEKTETTQTQQSTTSSNIQYAQQKYDDIQQINIASQKHIQTQNTQSHHSNEATSLDYGLD